MLRIKNVAYPVKDLQQTTVFYQETFGLTPQFVDGSRWAQFKVDGTTFALSAEEETPDGLKESAVVTFEVADLDDFVEGLVDQGIVVSAIRDLQGHGKTCWLKDPAGNIVQLYGR